MKIHHTIASIAAALLALTAGAQPTPNTATATTSAHAAPIGAPPDLGMVPHGLFAPPIELSVSFSTASKETDIIAIDHAATVEIVATLENTSAKSLTIIGTGPNPLALTRSGKSLAPGEKTSVAVVVAPTFGAYPIAVNLGALYSVAGEQPLRFATTRARLAPDDVVVPSLDRVFWRGDESDERRITVRVPAGATLKEIKVRGDFSARLENGAIFVKPFPPNPGDSTHGPVATIALPPGASLTGDQGTGRTSPTAGSILLQIDPVPTYHLAPISLSAQPKIKFIAAPTVSATSATAK